MGFAPPPHDGFALLASAHRCAYLATNTSYIASQPQAILLGGSFAQRDDASVLLCVALSCPPYLPGGDECAMNSEGLGVIFLHICCFSQHFNELGVNFIENVAHSTFETLEAASGRF